MTSKVFYTQYESKVWTQIAKVSEVAFKILLQVVISHSYSVQRKISYLFQDRFWLFEMLDCVVILGECIGVVRIFIKAFLEVKCVF